MDKRALQNKDCQDYRYYKSINPEVYKEFSRDCLRCGRSFTVKHRYIRTCEKCKYNDKLVKEIRGYLIKG